MSGRTGPTADGHVIPELLTAKEKITAPPFIASKPVPVVSFRGDQNEQDALERKEQPGKFGFVITSSRDYARVEGFACDLEGLVASRDDDSTQRIRESPGLREPAPSTTNPRNRKRRVSDSFEIEESWNPCEDDATAEVVRVVEKLSLEESNPGVRTTENRSKDSTEKSFRRSLLESPLARPELLLRVDELDEDVPLTQLENVTALSRSLIPPELLKPPKPKRPIVAGKNKMATTVSAPNSMNTKSRSLRKRLSSSLSSKSKKGEDFRNAIDNIPEPKPGKKNGLEPDDLMDRGRGRRGASPTIDHPPRISRAKPLREIPPIMTTGSAETPVKSNRTEPSPTPDDAGHGRGRGGIVERIRSASRSRSRSRKESSESREDTKSILIAVTSCRSDAYHNQKAPGSTSKLPRKAPSNLKLFHELAVGVKDAYAAAGETPTRPDPEAWSKHMSQEEITARIILWEFLGNLDFLLALVDEVATDTVTRGALKDDTTFKSLRDVIKKCNKVVETMLVRREQKYTLFFRLIQPQDAKEIERIQAWNSKVEKAVGAVAEGNTTAEDDTEPSDSESEISVASTATDASSRKGVFSRGRQLLPTAGRVRARRATPTPRLRQRSGGMNENSDAVAAEDGYSAVTSHITRGNLAMLQRSLATSDSSLGSKAGMHLNVNGGSKEELAPVKPMEPKDELVDVIRGLRIENLKSREGRADSELANLKPNWLPKADIPSAVPKLPVEYIHRHRLMKQVVNCLLDKSGAGPRDTDEEVAISNIITAITSRHGDKAGNGKTTLAVAAIQAVEVRERFSDGIAWVHLGRNPLSEEDVRRLYEEIYRQLLHVELQNEDESDTESKTSSGDKEDTQSRGSSMDSIERAGRSATERGYALHLANTRRQFEGGDIEGIKEDLGRLLASRKVLICLDDVWRIEDAKWFIFENQISENASGRRNKDIQDNLRILITTRTPGLLGPGVVQEVFVRIFSEQEAVKLLLSSAGRRPYGGKNSAVYNQARAIVKGCGNSPLAVRIAGGMLRRSNRNWNLRSPTWTALNQQCRVNLDEATRLRSFQNSATRIIDLSFAMVEDVALRSAVRRCFVTFAVAFRDNEWLLVGRGIPQAVVFKLFGTVVGRQGTNLPSPDGILHSLEAMNLIQRARHGVSSRSHQIVEVSESDDSSDDKEEPSQITHGFTDNPSFVIHDSIKAIAEEIAQRSTAAFVPTVDEFTSFGKEIEVERKYVEAKHGAVWNPVRYLARQLSNPKDFDRNATEESAVNELVVNSLLDLSGSLEKASISDAFYDSKDTTKSLKGGEKMEEYMMAFLPTHLLHAKAYAGAAEILVDPTFVRRRVRALGVIEATRRHVADLLELRREQSKIGPESWGVGGGGRASFARDSDMHLAISPTSHEEARVTELEEVRQEAAMSVLADIDINVVLRDGSRLVIDEAYSVVNRSSDSLDSHNKANSLTAVGEGLLKDSLNMAICLAAVGEGLLKGRQPRDAMLRLEEAVGIYRGLLGAYHIDVARALHNVARALVKLGETRVALLKFSEAARIFDACNATLHYDSIANAQNLASLLVDIEDWSKADEKLEEVISMKRSVYGANSIVVAKAINNYAILLAKHGRMNEALVHYQSAMDTYAATSPAMIRDPEFELKCNYDMTLISLNIASILSKKGDLEGAIKSYENGVEGLRHHAEEQARLELSTTKGTSQNKHLVAALGRIGSLKLKLGDRDGALEAYTALLLEVDDTSPLSSKVEKAKAHIKCATICRQQDGKGSRIKSISHLREALEMYTSLFGPENKDTLAIASSLRQWLTEEQDAQREITQTASGGRIA